MMSIYKNSSKNRNSRYVQGSTSIDQYNNRLGWCERKVFEKSFTDITVTILPNEEHKPDFLAYRVYGRESLMWLVLQYNNIVDITEEFIAGVELVLPSPDRVMREILTKGTGSNVIKK